ncbi:MAG: hypothetical protein R3B06_28385 [Kofleriaceae bacterium]
MTALTLRREYLAQHRRLAVARALATTVASLVPVPFVDDWLREAILGGAYKRIAASYHIDLAPLAVKNLVHGRSQPASWVDLTSSALAVRLASQSVKRVMLAVTAMRRAQAASRTFARLTLFDHYCARVHTGLGLDGPRGLALADAIGATLAATPGGLSFEPFRKGALAAARSVAKAPLALADLASGGRLRKLLTRGAGDVAEAQVVDELDQLVERELADQDGWLAKAVTAIELQLTAEVNPFLDQAIERFDETWRSQA